MSSGSSSDGEFLRNVYDLSSQTDTDEYYTEWAANEALTGGTAEQVSAEHGPHIEGLGSSSTVFVLRRS